MHAIGAQRIRGRAQTRCQSRGQVRTVRHRHQRNLLGQDREQNPARGGQRPQDLPLASQPKFLWLNGSADGWWVWDVQLWTGVNHPIATPGIPSRRKSVKESIDALSQLLLVMRYRLVHIGHGQPQLLTRRPMRGEADNSGDESPRVFRSNQHDQILLNVQGRTLEWAEIADGVRVVQPRRNHFGRFRCRLRSFGQAHGYNFGCIGEQSLLLGQIVGVQIIFDQERSVAQSSRSHGQPRRSWPKGQLIDPRRYVACVGRRRSFSCHRNFPDE
jgi:hypothetical protein